MKKMILLAAVLMAAPAWADYGACRDDAQRLCPKKGGPARWHCLEEHQPQLSPACQQSLRRMRAEGEDFRRDCKDDASKLCPGRQGRGLMDCLEDALPELSAACGERVRKVQEGHRVRKERIPAACREDSEKLCTAPGAAPDGIRACLKAGGGKLSEACRKALSESGK